MTMFKKAYRNSCILGVWSGSWDSGIFNLETWTLDDWSLVTLDEWMLGPWTLGLKMTARLDSGLRVACTLDHWTLGT